MADVQKYFLDFDGSIKLERNDEKAKLSEKRERVLRRLSEGIKRQRDEGEEIPSYECFNQGSYKMDTGVKPLDADYDIDVGVRFKLAKDDYPDPLTVKKWVHDAVDGHTKKVEMRRSCVTVFYQESGEPIYHVDLAVYSGSENNPDRKGYLAKGKLGSALAHRVWEESDPEGLCNCIANRHSDADAHQFRRVIRALKRWKDERFSKDGNTAPKGIALTVAAHWWFQPSKKVTDVFANTVEYEDLTALRGLVRTMLANFQPVWNAQEMRFTSRLRVSLPVAPYSDLCEKMTDAQMAEFKSRLEALLEAADKAHVDVDPHTACKELRKHFGDDFPVPEKRETAKKPGRAITSSGNSA